MDGTTKRAGFGIQVGRRRILGFAAGGAAAGILAACGGNDVATTTAGGAATSGSAGGTVRPTSQGQVTISTSTGAPAAASAPATTAGATAGATSAMTAATSAPTGASSTAITMMRPELKGAISLARQFDPPLSGGKPDPRTTVFKDLLKQYQTEHPGVTVELTEIPGTTATEIYQWVDTHFAGKNLATVVATYPEQTTTDVQEANNTVPWVNITSALDGPSAYGAPRWRDDIDPNLFLFTKFGLKNNYSLPFTTYKSAWVYNKDAWKKAGLTDADEPKTWTQWFAVCEKLKAAGFIPIARQGDVQALSHTSWILMIALGRKQWDGLSSGSQFISLQQKLDAVCGMKWTMDTPWSRAGWPALKKLITYWNPGYSTLKVNDVRQLWFTGKAAMIYESQAFLNLYDESKAEGTTKFDIGAFPTPQPDAQVFGADIAMNAGRIADDGERGITYGIPLADVREKGKDAMGQAIAIDYLQYMTSTKIQAQFVKPGYDLPVNKNVKLEDSRFTLFYQNPEQIFYRHLFYFNNLSHADRPQWGQNLLAYLTDGESLDDYLKKGEQQLLDQGTIAARTANITIKCA